MAKKYKTEQPRGMYLKPLAAKNAAQEHYISMLGESTIMFCAGPAGTGKTFLATHVALDALLKKEVDKIILTRPIVAVEDIGYLPGDMNEKIHPYVLPLLDAIELHVGPTKTQELLDDRRLEILPLAYMRGRSLNNCFLLLDEAQNTTKEQMKMFLTRIGYDTKVSVNGDVSQSDLPRGIESGLNWAVSKLVGVSPEISIVEFSNTNIVRNPLIETILTHLT